MGVHPQLPNVSGIGTSSGDISTESGSPFSEPILDLNQYLVILTSIVVEETRPNEIVQAIGVDRRGISTYTQKFEHLWLVERDNPLTEKNAKSRRGRYCLPFSWFWSIYGNEDHYERLVKDAYQTLIELEPGTSSPGFRDDCEPSGVRR